eukprot:gene1009-580_t
MPTSPPFSPSVAGTSTKPPQKVESSASSGLESLLHYLQNEDFVFSVGMWAWNHSENFPNGDPETWEHQHEFVNLHNEYKQLFDNRVERFFESKIDPSLPNQETLISQVHDLCQATPTKGSHLIDALTASEDYLKFCEYMQRVKMRRAWAEEANPLTSELVEAVKDGAEGKSDKANVPTSPKNFEDLD